LPGTVTLDDARQSQLNYFEGGKAFLASHAFAAAFDLIAVVGQAGIDYPGILC
jgi:hypothetical protein